MRLLSKINNIDQFKVVKMNDYPLYKIKKCIDEKGDIFIQKRPPYSQPEPKIKPGLYDINDNLILPITKEMVETDYSLFSYAHDYTDAVKVVLPDTITYIGSHQFYMCSHLKDIIIPDGVTIIGNSAFYATNFNSIHLPDTVTTIETNAFYHCFTKDVTLGNSLTTIGFDAFGGWKGNTLIIPATVTFIDELAFMESDITSVTFMNTKTNEWCYYPPQSPKSKTVVSVTDARTNATNLKKYKGYCWEPYYR